MEQYRIFVRGYKYLYRSLQSVEASSEDYHRWLEMASTAIESLERMLNSSNITRAEKQSYSASLGHFISIQLRLLNLLERRGGEIHQLDQDQAAPPGQAARVSWRDVQAAFENRIRTGVITNLGRMDIHEFLKEVQPLFESKIEEALRAHPSVKVNVVLYAQFSTIQMDLDVKHFTTENKSIYRSTDISEVYQHFKNTLCQDVEEAEGQGSGWSLISILSLQVNINKLNPMHANTFIPLPTPIYNKHACVNVKNNDDQCFKWSVLAALHEIKKNASELSHYLPYQNDLNFDGITFPVRIKDVSKFEKQNEVSINVYHLIKRSQEYKVAPVHLTSLRKEKHANLLIIQDVYIDEECDDLEVTGEPKYHYVLIRDLSRLIRSQLSNHRCKCFVCERCLHYFWQEEKLKAHLRDCSSLNQCRIELPTVQNSKLRFKNYYRKERVPVVVYADFECLLREPIKEHDRVIQTHQAFSVGFYVKYSFDDSLSEYKCYRQTSADDLKTPSQWFIEQLKEIAVSMDARFSNAKPMKLTREDWLKYELQETCHICGRPFSADDPKVRDHCHLSGVFRGAAHQSCNLNYKNAKYIPVVFHNLTGYDSHLFIKDLATSEVMKGHVKLIPLNKQKYISFIKHVDDTKNNVHFRFIDSFRFMPSSLDKLASYLDTHPIVDKEFSAYTSEQIKLLKRKGVYPYDYTRSFESLREQQLPSIERFYSIMSEQTISEEDYQHAQDVWNSFHIKTLGEYSDLYLKTDVLLLADVFENFRNMCIESYELDSAHYFTTPGYAWDACLKLTNVTLALITDIDVLLFIERAIRGGISQCSNRYAEANHKYMSSYDASKEEKYLMYYDVNNLYGYAMMQSLPYGGFQWVESSTIEKNPKFWDVSPESEKGYFLEVDLEYPRTLHDDHKDLPFCAEKMVPPGSKTSKLLTTLYNKQRYVLHYLTLKQVTEQGLRVTKIHRALEFLQKPWMKPYIDFNSAKRQAATNSFEIMYWKLMNNSAYGKTMESERKRVSVKLVNHWDGRFGAEAYISRPDFKNCTIFDEDL
ncbi:uncharacterized protein LOC106658308, partial [Trichogramma pretiosum]|uniref:uncharacterized protein LOC106658308 n=1 Tax=Trichogramma pretiosum TaxID=7493 RepID=UPI000C71AE77